MSARQVKVEEWPELAMTTAKSCGTCQHYHPNQFRFFIGSCKHGRWITKTIAGVSTTANKTCSYWQEPAP